MNEEQTKVLECEVSDLRAEALLYRQQLEACYESARRAIQEDNVAAFHRIIGLTHLPDLTVPPTEEARTWARDFMHAHEKTTRASETAVASLMKIQALAEQLGSNDNVEELRQNILAETRRGLDLHI